MSKLATKGPYRIVLDARVCLYMCLGALGSGFCSVSEMEICRKYSRTCDKDGRNISRAGMRAAMATFPRQ